MNLTKSRKAQCQNTRCARVATVHLMQTNRPGVYPRESDLALCQEHAGEASRNPHIQVRYIGRSPKGYHVNFRYIAISGLAKVPAGFDLKPV